MIDFVLFFFFNLAYCRKIPWEFKFESCWWLCHRWWRRYCWWHHHCKSIKKKKICWVTWKKKKKKKSAQQVLYKASNQHLVSSTGSHFCCFLLLVVKRTLDCETSYEATSHLQSFPFSARKVCSKKGKPIPVENVWKSAAAAASHRIDDPFCFFCWLEKGTPVPSRVEEKWKIPEEEESGATRTRRTLCRRVE